MEKIAILLPRQTILEYARNVLAQEQIDVQLLKVVENANAVSEAQNAAAAGVRVIIARGLQATLIKENTGIPVVEMPVTVREIGLIILKAREMFKKEHPIIGIVVFANMFQSLERLGGSCLDVISAFMNWRSWRRPVPRSARRLARVWI